jgi:NAD(P)-dependent dehydrogenase (short-subunit alcohol dehydrogenase family)
MGLFRGARETSPQTKGSDITRGAGGARARNDQPVFDRARERGTDGKIGQLNPLKRAGQPHELAAMGLLLASDHASYVNGQAIPVDGGLTASMPYAGKPV